MNLLIVEDQSGPLWNLQRSVDLVIPKFYLDFIKGSSVIARSYQSAQESLEAKRYDIVLLDHRLPYQDTGDLEDSDFNAFCKTLENVGYSLIPQIKRRDLLTVVIGTSSLGGEELSRFPKPDYSVKKIEDNLPEQLEFILRKVEEQRK